MGKDRLSTGIEGLDEIVGGGFPRGRVILLLGESGSGKTIFTNQFLSNGVLQYKEKGLLVSLEETHSQLLREMSLFGWNLQEMENKGHLGFIDATPLRLLPKIVKVGSAEVERKEFSMMSLIDRINEEVTRLKPSRLVVDSVTSLTMQFEDPVERRFAVMELIAALESTGATCMMTSELRTFDPLRNVEIEEVLSHGVIVLQAMLVGTSYARAIQIRKMRETKCDLQPRPYTIDDDGIKVYPSESVLR